MTLSSSSYYRTKRFHFPQLRYNETAREKGEDEEKKKKKDKEQNAVYI